MHQESSASQGQTYPPLAGHAQVRTGAKTGSICACADVDFGRYSGAHFAVGRLVDAAGALEGCPVGETPVPHVAKPPELLRRPLTPHVAWVSSEAMQRFGSKSSAISRTFTKVAQAMWSADRRARYPRTKSWLAHHQTSCVGEVDRWVPCEIALPSPKGHFAP